MLALEEYLNIARILIKKHGLKEMLNNDEAIGYVASYIMTADNQFNEKIGNIYGYRKMYAKFGIRNFIERNLKNKKTINLYRDKNDKMEDIVSNENTVNNVQLNEILRYIDVLKPEQRKLIELYYFESMTLKEIGEVFHITTQAVHLRLKTVLGILRRKFNV